jgi:hypothetical protein
MFPHLPIALMAVLSPITVSDTVPTFNIARECRFENNSPNPNQTEVISTGAFDGCSKDEGDALQRLQTEWDQFNAGDKHTCIAETNIGEHPSYVELLTCLELANELRDGSSEPLERLENRKSKPTKQELSEKRVGDERNPN